MTRVYASGRILEPDEARDVEAQRQVDLRLCKDCGNYRDGNCMAAGNLRQDWINGGKTSRNSIDFLRAADSLCGEDARWFIRKSYDFGGKAA